MVCAGRSILDRLMAHGAGAEPGSAPGCGNASMRHAPCAIVWPAGIAHRRRWRERQPAPSKRERTPARRFRSPARTPRRPSTTRASTRPGRPTISGPSGGRWKAPAPACRRPEAGRRAYACASWPRSRAPMVHRRRRPLRDCAQQATLDTLQQTLELVRLRHALGDAAADVERRTPNGQQSTALIPDIQARQRPRYQPGRAAGRAAGAGAGTAGWP